jgi:hypothetical protein
MYTSSGLYPNLNLTISKGGTGILCWEDSKHDRLGEWSDKEYNDWTAVEELTNLPDEAFHRNVDKIVLEAGTQYAASVKTAVVCPPTIYGAFCSLLLSSHHRQSLQQMMQGGLVGCITSKMNTTDANPSNQAKVAAPQTRAADKPTNSQSSS